MSKYCKKQKVHRQKQPQQPTITKSDQHLKIILSQFESTISKMFDEFHDDYQRRAFQEIFFQKLRSYLSLKKLEFTRLNRNKEWLEKGLSLSVDYQTSKLLFNRLQEIYNPDAFIQLLGVVLLIHKIGVKPQNNPQSSDVEALNHFTLNFTTIKEQIGKSSVYEYLYDYVQKKVKIISIEEEQRIHSMKIFNKIVKGSIIYENKL